MMLHQARVTRNNASYTSFACLQRNSLRYSLFPLERLVLARRSTRDDLDQLACDHGLSGAVVENGEFIDHVAGVLESIVSIAFLDSDR